MCAPMGSATSLNKAPLPLALAPHPARALRERAVARNKQKPTQRRKSKKIHTCVLDVNNEFCLNSYIIDFARTRENDHNTKTWPAFTSRRIYLAIGIFLRFLVDLVPIRMESLVPAQRVSVSFRETTFGRRLFHQPPVPKRSVAISETCDGA